MNRLKLAFVSFGFLGLSPFAPGTAGTLGGVLLAWLLGRSENYLFWSLCACALLYAVGRSLGEWSERYAGGKDPGFFVVDEVIGYLLTCLWTRGPSPLALTVAFFLFRFLDIVKPPPARRMERLGGGDGILLDDVVSGLYGLLVMTILRLFVLAPENWVAG
ncbi:MAG: phosphatidylglycerophosphatase A [Planctomycetes bacterium]|nr:phosphatidylglycerophosphatase A [Planctomycetota bacterium]